MRGLAQRRRNVDLERIAQQIVPQGDRRLSPALIRCNATWLALTDGGAANLIAPSPMRQAERRSARPMSAVFEKHPRVPAKCGL